MTEDATSADAARGADSALDAESRPDRDTGTPLDAEGRDDGGDDGGTRPDAATCVPTADSVDTDLDGVFDECDVCPAHVDPRQLDVDGDGRGWACDPVEELPFYAAAGINGHYANGIYALGTPDHLFTVSREGALVTGRLDGTDAALQLAHGRASNVWVGGSTAVFSGGFLGSYLALHVDDGVVTRPLRDLYEGSGAALAATPAGVLFVAPAAETGGEWLFGLSRAGEPALVLGHSYADLCGGEPPLLFDTFGAALVIDGTLVRDLRPTPVDWPYSLRCNRTYCTREDGTLRAYRISAAGSSTFAFDTHHPTASCHEIQQWGGGIPHEVIVTVDADAPLGAALATVVIRTDGVERTWRQRVDATPTVHFGDTGAYIAWANRAGTTYEHVDLASGAVTDLGVTLHGIPVVRVRGDRFAALGSTEELSSTRVMVADRARVVWNQTFLGSPGGLVLGEDVVALRHGTVAEAWASSVAEPLVLGDDVRGFGGAAHYDSVLLDFHTERETSTTALRVAGGTFVRTEMTALRGHRPAFSSWELSRGDAARWIQSWSPSFVARVARGSDGNLVLTDVLPGGIIVQRLESDDAILAVVSSGPERIVARLGSTLETLLRGSRADILDVGPVHSFVSIVSDSSASVCRVRGSPSIECWAIGAETLLAGGFYSQGNEVFAGVGFVDGQISAIRTVGPADVLIAP